MYIQILIYVIIGALFAAWFFTKIDFEKNNEKLEDPLFITLLTVFLVVGWPILSIFIFVFMVYWTIRKVKQ